MANSISDHVQNGLPRSSVYDFVQGTGDIFIRSDDVEIMPSTNADTYSYNENKKISFELSNPSDNLYVDLRSHYIKFNIAVTDAGEEGDDGTSGGIAEPMANIVDELVIKCGDQTVEQIRHYNNLQSAFNRILIGDRSVKKNLLAGRVGHSRTC